MILDAPNILIALALLVELALLLAALVRRRGQRTVTLAALLVVAMATTALPLLPGDSLFLAQRSSASLFWAAAILLTILYGLLALQDLGWKQPVRIWLALGVIWFGSYLATLFIAGVPLAGWTSWRDGVSILGVVVVLAGIVLFYFGLGILLLLRFSRTSIPEIANRSVYWLIGASLFFLASFLFTSGTAGLQLVGIAVLLISVLLTTLSILRQHLPDLRSLVFIGARSLALMAVTWVLMFAGLYYVTRNDLPEMLDLSSPSLLIVAIAGVALLLAALIVPARIVIDMLFRAIMARNQPSLPDAISLYSQHVARAATLDEVVSATTTTLNRVLGLRRSALILINSTFRLPDAVELIVLDGSSSIDRPRASGYLGKKSPIYRTLVVDKKGLFQYDIADDPAYRTVSEEERTLFRSLGMSAYVPLVAEDRLMGLLAGGPKLNGSLYQKADMELLFAIGHQVTTALRSARLIDDLQHLNDTMRVLNKRLENANTELEKMDAIKTDFITIASHELRTPLAQVRGYTDIIDSMLSEDPGTAQMINNLRKSTERMEELISAMLDVSQLDVNSMDLRFIRTTPAALIRLALEPLRDPAAQRDITITVGDMEGLPNVEADLQRLTQALRNIFMNAIKFTPDGGSIEVSATLETPSNAPEAVLFRIQDSGVGIAEKDIPFIFQKFYRGFDTQLHSTGIYKFMGAGPGLGLTIAKGIIEGHGGSIWVKSPGHSMTEMPGATFFVRLPLQPPEGSLRVLTFASGEDPRLSSSANPQAK